MHRKNSGSDEQNEFSLALLTSPGWSNVKSWIHVLEKLQFEEPRTKVDVFVHSPWILTNLDKTDELGARLDQLNARFVLINATGKLFPVDNFKTARKLALLLLIAEKISRLFSQMIGARGKLRKIDRAESKFFSPPYIAALSDVEIFLGKRTPSEYSVLSQLTGSTFCSLYHGSFFIGNQNESKSAGDVSLESFKDNLVFSTGRKLTKRYERVFQYEARIVKVYSPRLEEMDLARSEKNKNVSPESRDTVLFVGRRPHEVFEKPYSQSFRSFVGILRVISGSKYKKFLYKPHPNESALETFFGLLVLQIYGASVGVEVQKTSSQLESIKNAGICLTWFSGLSIDSQQLGIPSFQLISNEGNLGPSLSLDSDWLSIVQEGLIPSIQDSLELKEVLQMSHLELHKYLENYEEKKQEHFYEKSGTDIRKVESVLGKLIYMH